MNSYFRDSFTEKGLKKHGPEVFLPFVMVGCNDVMFGCNDVSFRPDIKRDNDIKNACYKNIVFQWN